MVDEFKKQMMKYFEMSDFGFMRYFLGIYVKQRPGRTFLSQEKYIDDLLNKFKMSECKPISTPMALNDMMMQKKFMNEPSKLHFAAAKRILRFLKGTKNLGIEFKKENNCKLIGYIDSDWAGSVDDPKSTSGYIFCLGSNVISWCLEKQKFVVLSSVEVEYITVTNLTCELFFKKEKNGTVLKHKKYTHLVSWEGRSLASCGGKVPHSPSDSSGSITPTPPSVSPNANWLGL
ncbi:uncharacterized protein LOC111400102 [Olea europaea var. sylvestris]|uniref:uncharacterized protein LOC111400102 n=1 Tax=Olea europaea var. sylvestris TaxID=158386 RepID=UPI000C1CE35F|nr:uncharacterized protein LOC111400102 [Olea europaea var. sylvestris]